MRIKLERLKNSKKRNFRIRMTRIFRWKCSRIRGVQLHRRKLSVSAIRLFLTLTLHWLQSMRVLTDCAVNASHQSIVKRTIMIGERVHSWQDSSAQWQKNKIQRNILKRRKTYFDKVTRFCTSTSSFSCTNTLTITPINLSLS